MANICAPQHQHAEAHLLKAKRTPSPIAIASAASIAPLHRPIKLCQTSTAKNDANNSGVNSYGGVMGHMPPHLHCTDSKSFISRVGGGASPSSRVRAFVTSSIIMDITTVVRFCRPQGSSVAQVLTWYPFRPKFQSERLGVAARCTN
jgi:hypothetical protein